MGDSENGGGGDTPQVVAVEIMERVLTIEEAIRDLRADIAQTGAVLPLGPLVIHIEDDTTGPVGRVKIRDSDETAVVDLSMHSMVVFKNESQTTDAWLKLPIGPFKTLHEEPVAQNSKVQFTLNKKFVGGSNCEYTFDYAVGPSGDGGGPNLIIRP